MLSIRAITKDYDGAPLLRGVSLEAAAGEVLCLLGPSGCGKSTLLRIVAGIETQESGEVWFDGSRIDGTPAHARDFGMMFQDGALFPHLSAADNIGFGLRMRGETPAMRRARTDELLALVGLSGFGPRKVYTLSGGERQRIALARTLAPEPRLLMLDEPLSALDRELHDRLLDELGQILARAGRGVTTLYVTHDQQEAFALADRIIVMREGLVAQAGTPDEIYRAPASADVARFLGFSNLLEAKVLSREADSIVARTALGDVRLAARPDLSADMPVMLLIRPEAARIGPQPGGWVVDGVVGERSFRGAQTRLQVTPARAPEMTLTLVVSGPAPAAGQPVTLTIAPSDCSLIPGPAR
ncbi:MAG TPA: ABC transporter ATP-binding protein [Thermoflexales bacterium]|jgi:ABC-type Fe3+/spermidine/putrescine transport system ATPase subunit|nr:ABC transporter ATP-binding protein [Thermoflexales bacterium]HRA54352.1 ABC transporter ATP-binding protein [Thermoflexales bacterium]